VATGKELVFLVDTGADISVVKENSDVFHDIHDNYIIDIRGISQEVNKSKGLTSVESFQVYAHNIMIYSDWKPNQ